jgi:hypothetical protein
VIESAAIFLSFIRNSSLSIGIKYILSAVLLVHYHIKKYSSDDNDTFCK